MAVFFVRFRWDGSDGSYLAFGSDRMLMPVYREFRGVDRDKRLKATRMNWPSCTKFLMGIDILEEGHFRSESAIQKRFGRIWTDAELLRELEGLPIDGSPRQVDEDDLGLECALDPLIDPMREHGE